MSSQTIVGSPEGKEGVGDVEEGRGGTEVMEGDLTWVVNTIQYPGDGL